MNHLSVVDVAGKLTLDPLRRKASLWKTTAAFKKRKEDSWAVRWTNGVSTTLAVDDTPWASLAVYCSARVSDCWKPQAIRSCLSVELVSVTPPVSLSSLSNVVKTPLVDFTASWKFWYTYVPPCQPPLQLFNLVWPPMNQSWKNLSVSSWLCP